MKKVLNINFILLFVIALFTKCSFEGTLFSDIITTITMSKCRYKNESDAGITSFNGTFVLNLEEIFWDPLNNNVFDPLTKEDISLKLDYVFVEGRGDIPSLSGITSNVKFEIFIQDNENKTYFHPFYTTWNNSTGNEYIAFTDFWNFSNYQDRIIEEDGLNEINEAFENEREEIYIVFKFSFEEVIEEGSLTFEYFDIDFDIPFEIEASSASNEG